MNETMLFAHFDRKQIVLDEPYELEPETRLIVTVLSEDKVSDEQEAWLHLSRQGLENAYSKDEPEYTLDMIRRPNPDYESSRFGQSSSKYHLLILKALSDYLVGK